MHHPTTKQPTGRAIILHFGGPVNLARLAAVHGIDPRPNVEQIKKWSQRDRIPGQYVLGLVALGGRIGKPLQLDTITPQTPHGESH